MNPHLLLRLPEHPDQSVHWLLWQNLPLQESQQADTSDDKADDKAGNETETAEKTGNKDRIAIIASGHWLSVSEFIEKFASADVKTDDDTGLLLANSRTTVLVPSARTTLHTMDAPGRLTPAVRQSLFWRLEEELSEDVDNFHFAVLHHANGLAHLAATNRSEMMLWHSWLEQAGVASRRWVPDALMLPWQESECTVLPFDGLVVARYGQWQTAVCEYNWLPLFLEGLKNEQPDLDVDTAELLAELALENHHSSPLALLLPETENTRCNLLQGEWQPASLWKQYLRPLVPTAIMMTVLLALITTNLVLNTRQLEQQIVAIQQQTNNIYQKLFPGERIVNLQSQMRQKLSALQPSGQSNQSMPSMLAQISPVLTAFPELKATSITYDGTRQNLRIQAEARNFELFTRLREKFENDITRGSEKQLTIAIDAVEKSGDKVTGQLVISGAQS